MQYDNLKINSTVYAVHNNHANKKIEGGKIQVCKVKTFYNHKGEIIPELKVVNSNAMINPTTYQIFFHLSDAIDAIRS